MLFRSDAVGAGVGHGLRRPLETRAIAGKGINRLGFSSSRRRMRLLELIDLADMLGMIRPETTVAPTRFSQIPEPDAPTPWRNPG